MFLKFSGEPAAASCVIERATSDFDVRPFADEIELAGVAGLLDEPTAAGSHSTRPRAELRPVGWLVEEAA